MKVSLNIWHTLTSSSINGSASTEVTVVDVVVVVVVVADAVLFAFGTLPKINEVALSASTLPTIPIMAERHRFTKPMTYYI